MAEAAADVHERVRRVEAALAAVERLPGTEREIAFDALQALLDLYGEGFRRVLARVDGTAALAQDELIGHLLMVHGLHPLGLQNPEDVPGAPGGPPLVRLEGVRR